MYSRVDAREVALLLGDPARVTALRTACSMTFPMGAGS